MTVYGQERLTVGLTSAPPFVLLDDGKPLGIDVWLWERVAEDLNIDFEYKTLPFRDLLEGLEKGSVDVCINPLTMTSDRSRHFDFTSPFFVSQSTAIVKNKRRNNGFLASLRPLFSRRFMGGLISLFVLVLIFGVLTWSFERKVNAEKFRSGWKGLGDGLWWSIVTMTTVGYGDKTPITRGGKIVAVLWMLTAILFISTLTASLSSLLVQEETDTSLFALEDLRDMHVGTMANTSSQSFLRQRYFQTVSTYDDLLKGITEVNEEKIDAFIYDEPILKYRIYKHEMEGLGFISDRFNMQLYAFGVNAEYHELAHRISERILFYTNTLEWKTILAEYSL